MQHFNIISSYYGLSLLLILLCFSCKNTSEETTVNNTLTEAAIDLPMENPKDVTLMAVKNPTSKNSSLPRLSASNDTLFMSWINKRDSLATLNYSYYVNGKWGSTQKISSGSDWFVNWADFPAIAVNNGTILSSHLQKSADGTYTYDVKLNLFDAQRKRWKNNFLLHKDGTKSEHGFVTLLPYVYNTFVAVWLDGRETVGKGHGGGNMTLRAAIVDSKGEISYDTLLDNKVCDCCQTSATITENNGILVAYRDRSDDEIRDISVVRWSEKDGWTKPKTIGQDNWKIPGCPVNGPSLDSYGANVGIAWFTAVKEEGDVMVAFSEDNGANFGTAYRIDVGNATGRVDITMLSNHEAAILWMEPDGNDEVIRLVKIDHKGNTGKPIVITRTSAERASGFPQLEKIGDTLYIAHTHLNKDLKIIRTISIQITDL